ncbi:shikimate dehydrogenase [Marinihelvus fidelis]|uniref:Shikimate dehydrogenase (NADP(+)) n=1 Tax=Marinihelvus fidelis TaxID=2613842 RepID=A0A5N0T8G0_9GAMM|nr:shikimate dehydrogenase [Marinihelvus fidelis]KAA9131315.1 shikimate dehydrogenase [Marinihelvus fidelis]
MSERPALRLAIFGSPVAQSKSPLIHPMFGRQFGIDIHYDAREAPAGTLADALAAFAAEGGQGGNITAPLKQEVRALATTCSRRVELAGAANTLVRRDGGWHAENTDGAGLVSDLERLGLAPAGKTIIILGAGGATRGALAALLDAGARRIDIYNRTAATAEALARAHADLGDVRGFGFGQLDQARAADLVMNATSLGHHGDLPPLRNALFAPGATCYDFNYGAAATPILGWCAANDIAAHDGLGMLVGQAVVSFEIWTGKRPDPAPVMAFLRGES